ncbi:MAG TPA: TonB-dependent siderophore receptor [Verrucomicrobiae bacterium]
MNETKRGHLATALMMAPGLAVADGVTNAPASPLLNTTNQLPEVVVQGQGETPYKVDRLSGAKFTEALVDTPQTIVAIPKEVYNQQGAATLSEVLRNTPGISFAAGEGGSVAAGDSFYMRGADASGNIFVDGVRDTGAYSRDVYNIEQVEIAKGPAGADNGRGGTSGYINMATKTPTGGQAYDATASYGSGEKTRGTFDFNQPLDFGKKGDWINGTSLRLNGMAQQGGVAGRDLVEDNRWGVSPSLALGLGSPTRIFLAGSWLTQNNRPDSGLPLAALPGGLFNGVNQANYYGLNSDYDDVNGGRITARVEHDFSDSFTLRNQFVYARTDRDALTTYIQNASSVNTNTAMVTPRRIHVETQNQVFSEQLNGTLNFETWKFEHDLSAGLELSRETQYSPIWTATNGPATSLYNPDPARTVAANQTPASAGTVTDARTDTAAGYIFETLKLNQYVQLNGSVRVEAYETDYNTLSTTGDIVSWKSGIVFKPRENGSLYFSYANSYVPPGTTFTLSTTANNANNPIFQPQENINYEVGTKWEFFKQRLSTSLALYRSENLNNIVQDPATLEYVQDAKNVVQGVELGLSGKLTEAWMVFGGLGYAHSEYAAPATSSGGANSGAELRYTPEWSASLWTAYKMKFGLTVGFGLQYSASVVRSTSNTQVATATAGAAAPEYLLFNAMLGYDVTKNLSLRLNINNLTDEFYYRLNNNGGRYYPGTPRTFLLSADFRF